MTHERETMKPSIRVEAGLMGHNARVFFIDKDGTETEISACCRAVTADVRVGQVTQATLEVFLCEGSTFHSEISDVILHKLKPRSLRRRLRDVTGIGQQVSQWIRA